MIDVIKDTLFDSIKLLPFLFLAYLRFWVFLLHFLHFLRKNREFVLCICNSHSRFSKKFVPFFRLIPCFSDYSLKIFEQIKGCCIFAHHCVFATIPSPALSFCACAQRWKHPCPGCGRRPLHCRSGCTPAGCN